MVSRRKLEKLNIRVIEGDRKETDPKTPRRAFCLVSTDLIDTSRRLEIDPSLYGKTVDGITYGDPRIHVNMQLLPKPDKGGFDL